MDEIKHDLQESRLRWFGHVMQRERISNKMLNVKMV